MTGHFAKNIAVMKPILLFAIFSMGFQVSEASAETELETLRARCIEQDRQIKELEEQLEKQQAGDTKPAAAPVATVVPETSGKTHKIQQGETYSSISRKYSISVEALLAANPSVKPTALRPGQIICLSPGAPAPKPVTLTPPPTKSQLAKLDPTSPAPPAKKTDSTTTPPPANAATTASASSEKKVRSVMIETEMSYAEFATKHGTNTGRLNDLNGLDLTDTTVLAKGSELYVPQ